MSSDPGTHNYLHVFNMAKMKSQKRNGSCRMKWTGKDREGFSGNDKSSKVCWKK